MNTISRAALLCSAAIAAPDARRQLSDQYCYYDYEGYYNFDTEEYEWSDENCPNTYNYDMYYYCDEQFKEVC